MDPMPHYQGLLLNFGGVVTTDFFASLGYCERLGLPHDSFRNLVTTDSTGRELPRCMLAPVASGRGRLRRCGPLRHGTIAGSVRCHARATPSATGLEVGARRAILG
jgi:hypothetical protein